MYWFEKVNINWIQSMAINVMKNGPLPKHVAIIVDGNRRYAKINGIPRARAHEMGYDLAARTFQWCLALGIPEVTIFGVSINNLKRPEEQVNSLMDIIVGERFRSLLNHREQLKEWGVRIRVIGNLSLLPKDMQKILAEAVVMTKDNDRCFFNFAMPYSSTDEVTHAVRDILDGVEKREILLEEITEELISECLFMTRSPEPDLLIRTSGEYRLSDFLVWQSTCTCIYFSKLYWPEFTLWELLAAVFYYQRSYADMEAVKRTLKPLPSIHDNNRLMNFIDELERGRHRMFLKMSRYHRGMKL